MVTFKNGSTIGFKTFAQERERWQGGTLHGIWLDEEPAWDIFQECLPRLVAHNGQLIFTMTSLCGFTKIVELLIHADKAKGIETFFVSTWENSKQLGGALDEAAIEALELQYDDPDERKARIHGIPSPKSGQVFKNFQDAFPTVIPFEKCQDCNPAWSTIVSIDPHGHTPHCVLWIQVAPSGHLYIMKERGWLKSDGKLDRVPWITLDELARQINYENYGLNIENLLIDKHGSGAQNAVTGTSIVDELFRKGLMCHPAGGDVTNKILITQRYFREKKIHIQANCWNLLWEIRRYVWMEHISSKTSERKEEHQKPRKKDDHLIDCMMNAIAYINSAGIIQAQVQKTDSVRRNPNQLETVNEADLYQRQNEEYHPDLMSIYE
jgi:phage terminase large subunit-like protein